MSKQVYTVTKEGIEYLCGLIRDVVSLPSEMISNINLADNLTFSNIHIKDLIDQCLKDANEYSNEVVNSLTHLAAEKIDFEPTLDNTTDKINTLLLYSANSDNNYTQYLRLTNELLNIGDTSLSLNEYMKEVDADTKYTLKTTTDTLTDNFIAHENDTGIHITSDERTRWNNTADEVGGADLVKKAEIKTTTLDKNSTNDEIYSGKAIYKTINNVVAYAQSYSLDEQLTGGTWIDGKPIYRKVIVSTFELPVGSSKTITLSDVGVNNVDTPISFNFLAVDGTVKGIRNNKLSYDFVPLQLIIANITSNWSLASGEQKIVIEYTKTTDV